MPLTDMPLSQLRVYRPAIHEPRDFDEFWRTTIDEARAAGSARETGIRLVPAETPVTELIIEDLTFPGYGGDPVRAWISRPKISPRQLLPAVIEFNGYNGGRGLPGERASWALAGAVHVMMDTRGQGSGWGTGGDTPDPHGSGPHVAGWMTNGILDPKAHYYRRVYTDALRLIDAVATLEFVDPARIALTGGSQGGGIAIAATSLAEEYARGSVIATMPDVAFLADWRNGTDVAISDPYQELARYLSVHREHADTVWNTASYFDVVNFAKRITVPALFSVALMDEIVPPRTTFAAFNALRSTVASIEVYPYNGHEGGGAYQWQKQVAFFRELAHKH